MRPLLPTRRGLEKYLEQIDRTRHYSNFGPLVLRFEDKLARRFGAPAGGVITACNGTLALSATLAEAAVPGKTKCIVPGWAFVACIRAVELAGLEPVVADPDIDLWALDPAVASSIAEICPDEIAAALLVSPFGAPLDITDWERWSHEAGIPVVIDAAAGFDAVRATKLPTVVSFHATKPLGVGEGGCIVTTDIGFAQRVRDRTNFGLPADVPSDGFAANAKMNEFSAAVGLAALEGWEERRATLVRVARGYVSDARLVEVGSFQAGFGESWIGATANIRLNKEAAETVAQRLSDAGIETRRWWAKGTLWRLGEQGETLDLPVSRELDRSVLGLPFYPDLTSSEQDQVIRALAG